MYQINNPYQNPGYPAMPNTPNPYPNNFGQLNQMNDMYYRQPVRPAIFGRIVGNESEIVPNEVAMDGTVSYFPMSDGSCIFAKKWRTDGTIQTLKFAPVFDKTEPAKNESTVLAGDICADIQLIAERLSKIEDLLTSDSTRITIKEGSK